MLFMRLEVLLASILASIILGLQYAETRQARVLDMLARLLRLHLVVNTRAELNQLGEGSLLMAQEVTNPWVEELALHLPSVEGEEGAALHSPCLLQFRLRMAILRRVTVTSPPGEACALLAASDPQPALHRAGGCGVDVRSLWEGCPLVTTFNGIPLEVQGVGWSPEGGEGFLWVTRNHLGRSYREWMAGTKKAFHRDYRARGGQLGLQAWARARWSPRQVTITVTQALSLQATRRLVGVKPWAWSDTLANWILLDQSFQQKKRLSKYYKGSQSYECIKTVKCEILMTEV